MKRDFSLLKKNVFGCLLGGAVGDALGAPFEGLWGETIPGKKELLQRFAEFEGFPEGQFTDDTQLTLATVESIVSCQYINPFDIAGRMFRLWKTNEIIGPGGACGFAASQFFLKKDWRSCGAPAGNAGNGTAMRTAVLGFCFLDEPEKLQTVVGDISLITHHDERSIAGGVAVAKTVELLLRGKELEGKLLCRKIAGEIEPISPVFAEKINDLTGYLDKEKTEAARFIAWAGMREPEFDEPIITPFVIPTVLASLWSIIRHPASWEKAVAEAIHFGGDVDTLGAITGGIMGARLGADSIPAHLLNKLPKKDHLARLAEKFYHLLAGSFGEKDLLALYREN